MSWRVTTLDGTGRESQSSAVPSRQQALDWAASLRGEGTQVVRITGPNETIEATEIEAAGDKRRSA